MGIESFVRDRKEAKVVDAEITEWLI